MWFVDYGRQGGALHERKCVHLCKTKDKPLHHQYHYRPLVWFVVEFTKLNVPSELEIIHSTTVTGIQHEWLR